MRSSDGGNGTPENSLPGPLHHSADEYARLKAILMENPRAARTEFARLLDAGTHQFDGLLSLASAPGEGRFRQMVANVARLHPKRNLVLDYLRIWLTEETDEFARRTIREVVRDADAVQLANYPAARQRASRAGPRIADHVHPASTGADSEGQDAEHFGEVDDLCALADTYRYVADRLCHRVRNSLAGVQAELLRLQATASLVQAPDAQPVLHEQIRRLRDLFNAIGRLVEFETDERQFNYRSVPLWEWVSAMTARFNAEPFRAVRVMATEYYLDVLFWNLWTNAIQATPESCRVTLAFAGRNDHLEVLVLDSGPGFTPGHFGVAFEEGFTTKAGPGKTHRGRGLLEAADAIRRMGGRARLVEARPGEYRIQLLFKREHL